jgi:protoporphyrinogen oxidase
MKLIKDMNKNKPKILILGAGMAGLGASIALKRAGYNSFILERASQPGGLFSNSSVAGCDFDYGPKILLLDGSENSRDILAFLGNNYQKYPVAEGVYLSKHGLLRYPLQRHLIDLPEKERGKILKDIELESRKKRAVYNFRDWLIRNYGKHFAKLILIPYEEKKWQIDLKKMDYRWALKRPIKVDLDEVKQGASFNLPPNRYYYYPKKGNISYLTKSMAEQAGKILLNKEVTAVDLINKKVTCGKNSYDYDILISTLPLDYLVQATSSLPPGIKKKSKSILNRLSIIIVNLVFEGNYDLKGTAIYFPEKNFIFRRVSVLENLCPALKREGKTPISVEVSIDPNKPLDIQDTYQKVLRDLKKVRQFEQLGYPIAYEIKKVGFAYPLQTRGHSYHVADLQRYFTAHDVYNCGRGGYFDYCNGDEAYKQGVDSAKNIIRKLESLEKEIVPSFTVGIPSYKSGASIINTIESLRGSEGVGNFDILISVDGPTLDKKIEQKLLEHEVKIIHNPKREGQTARNKQIAELAKTDYLIMTQDDVLFKPDTLEKIISSFRIDPNVTMIAPRVVPLKAQNYFEKILHVGARIVHKTTLEWRDGDNYLASIGRCLAYRTDTVKRFEIDDKVINCDAYYYFENKRQGGNFKYLNEAEVFYRSPKNMNDHLKQVRKFAVSEKEMTSYLRMDLNTEYKTPAKYILKGTGRRVCKKPDPDNSLSSRFVVQPNQA